MNSERLHHLLHPCPWGVCRLHGVRRAFFIHLFHLFLDEKWCALVFTFERTELFNKKAYLCLCIKRTGISPLHTQDSDDLFKWSPSDRSPRPCLYSSILTVL